ncbi:MAG: hypothetical protein ABIH46_03990, partial [Chloroflexota bacterium]
PTDSAALGGLRAEFQYVFPGPPLAQMASHAGFTRASGQALLPALFMGVITARTGHKGKRSTRGKALCAPPGLINLK